MKRVDVNLWMCLNEYCPCKDVQGTKYHVIGPVRGVIDVETKFQAKHRGRMMAVDFFAGMENRTTYGYQYTIPVVSGCLLRLDRRYSEQVLTQVLRTAVGICEIYGVSVLN